MDYVHHRLAIAGVKGTLFPLHLFKRIYKFSGGVPRLINLICDRSLLGTYTQNRLQVDSRTVDQAAEEIFGKQPRWTPRATALLVGLILIASVTAIGFRISSSPGTVPATDDTTTAEAAPVDATIVPTAPNESIDAAATQGITADIAEVATAPLDTAVFIQAEPSPQRPANPTPRYENLTDLLLQSSNENSRIAFHDLFNIWGTDYPVESTENPCDVAISVGLRCWHRLGSLRDIKHLDRPVILVVTDTNGRNLYITMSQHSEDAITLIVNGSPHLVHADEIHRHWNGKHSLLWRMPPQYQHPSKLGDQGVEIEWLEEQLTKIQNRSVRTERPLTFDAEMQRQVKQFQMSRGLLPDGVVGFQTWIHINSHGGAAIPYLAPPSEG